MKNLKVGDILRWPLSDRSYVITKVNSAEDLLTINRIDHNGMSIGRPVPYHISSALEKINIKEIIHTANKNKIKEKKKGPEMQHCPFCMAAWLNEDLTKPIKTCRYCGGNLF